MIFFPYLFYEKCESVLFCPLSPSPPSIKMIKKEGELAFLFPCSISSISALLLVTYVEERFGTL